jgi:hypothetical protein
MVEHARGETVECAGCHGTGVDLDDTAAGLLTESAAALSWDSRDSLVSCYASAARLIAGRGYPLASEALRDSIETLSIRCRALGLFEQAEHLDELGREAA